jgi:glycerophosphoryl diester phosphodiesterase
MDQFEFLDHPGPIPFAHRGGKGDWPENSWPAFENAVSLGFRYIETDVRATRDDVALLIHDQNLKRVSGREASIRSIDSQDATQLDLGDGRAIPRLEEVFDRWRDLRLNIDIKHPSALEPTIRAIQRADAVKRVCITSFQDFTIARARRYLGDGLCTGGGIASVSFLKAGSIAFPSIKIRRYRPRVNVIQVPKKFHGISVCDAQFIRYASFLQLPVHAWTINDVGSMEDLLTMGVQGLITDHPQTLKNLLIRRGEWYG